MRFSDISLGKLSAGFRSEMPSLVGIERATKRVLARWPDVVKNPPEKDRERILREMLRRVCEADWEETKLSFVTSAARIAFDPEFRARDDFGEVRRFFYEETAVSTHASFLSGLYSVYLSTYAPGSEHTVDLARALKSSQAHFGGRARLIHTKAPECLDPLEGHIRLCRRVEDDDSPWHSLETIGFAGPTSPGLIEHVHHEFVRRIAPKLARRAEIERLIEWLKPAGSESVRVAGAEEAITALLDPWVNKDPGESDMRFLTDRLLDLYGDPRVQTGSVWWRLPDRSRNVMLRWLTREDIDFFMRVVTAVEHEHMHKWAPRRDFWMRLYKEGRISDAWVAFSYFAELEAKKISKRIEGKNISFGRQIDRGNRRNTSLLLMKIGRKIVVEGSHDYKVHIFDEGSPDVPAMFRTNYSCERIRLRSRQSRSHVSGWQDWVLERI